MTANARIQELALARLVGRKIDIVGFAEGLLEIACNVGEIRCTLAAERGLRFEFEGDCCEVELDSNRAKLRILCARLSVLCSPPVSPYGGEGVIVTSRCRCTARFTNTPAEHEFSITPIQTMKA